MSVFNTDESKKIGLVKDYIKYVIREKNFLPIPALGNLRFPGAVDVVIAGGFFTSCLNDEQYKDIDVFVLNGNKNLYENLTSGYTDQQKQKRLQEKMMKQNGVGVTTSVDDFLGADEWERSDIMNYMNNPNILDVINNNHTKVQYMLTKYQTREELLEHFDYKHCKVSYVPQEDKLYINRETFDCIVDKRLVFNNKKGSQHWRTSKFLKKGWTLDNEAEGPIEFHETMLKPLTKNQFQASVQNIVEQAMANALNVGAGTYTIGEDALQSMGLTGEEFQKLLQGK